MNRIVFVTNVYRLRYPETQVETKRVAHALVLTLCAR